jgi:aminoglycoside phosphotransferase (APT) family kinase protein
MHEDEVDVDADVVRRLLAEQVPELAALPITRVASTGTVNALFRVGDEHVARLPLVAHWSDDIEREWQWLPWFAARITTVRLPEPVFKGRPDASYPFVWSVHRWIPGSPYDDTLVDDERAAAETLARFVLELRSLAVVVGAPIGGRDPLRVLDDDTREAIRDSAGVIDADMAMKVWEQALEAPAWNGDPSWIHGDLLRPNLIVQEGRLVAVIDFGFIGVGDPATDLMPAWSVFGPAGQEVFRSMLDPDDATWSRGRGIALHQAASVIPYYTETNPGFVELSRRAIEQIQADFVLRG